MKKRYVFILCFFLFLMFIRVEAARAPEPIRESGIATKGKEYSIEVLNEEITISSDEKNKAKANFQYEFFNVSEQNVALNFAFPLNWSHLYEEENQIKDYPIYFQQQEVTDKRLRYTLYDSYDVEELSKKIKDDYEENDFLHKDLSVYKTTFISSSTSYYPGYFECNIDWNQDKTLIIGNGYVDEGKYCGFINSGIFEVYCIGESLNFINMSFYDNSFDKNPVSWNFNSVEIKEMTFLEYINSLLPQDNTIPEMDWYNIMIEFLDQARCCYPISYEGFRFNLIEWVEYEISIPSRTSILHEVNIPLFARTDSSFDPYKYNFELYLSNAFLMPNDTTIKIKFNSPLHVLDTELSPIEIEDELYYVIGNLTSSSKTFSFSLCESSHPNERLSVFGVIFGIVVSVIIVAILIPLLVLMICFLKNKNKSRLDKLHWIEMMVLYISVSIAILSIFLLSGLRIIIGCLLVLAMTSIMILSFIEFIRYKSGLARFAVALLGSIFEIFTLIVDESDSFICVLAFIFGIALIILLSYSFSNHKKIKKNIEKEEGQQKTNDLPVGYFSKGFYRFVVGYIIVFFILGLFFLIFFANASLYGLIVFGVILLWIAAFFGLAILINYRDFKPYREFQKDLDFNKLETAIMEKLSQPKVNSETINYHKILLASFAITINLEKYQELVASIKPPKAKAYLFAYQTLEFNFLLSLDDFVAKKDSLKNQYSNQKIYLKKIKEFYFRWLIYYKGILENKTIDEICPYKTKNNFRNGVNLFIQIHYYYHQQKEEEFIKLKQLFLEKYSKLEVMKNKIEELK